MSDSEHYLSDSDSSENDENEIISKNPTEKNKKFNISGFEDSDEDDEEEEDEKKNDDLNNDIEEITNDIEEIDINEDSDYEDDDGEEDDDEDEEIDDEQGDGEDESKNNSTINKRKPKQQKTIIYSDSDEEPDDDNENYLQKFNSEINKSYIFENHPECFTHNYDEISKLSIVVRDNDNIIIDPLHKTCPFLTKYEKTKVLGQRAKQIENGCIPYVKVPENIVEGYIIAELELKEKRIPFIIRRPIPGGAFEYWFLKDLEIVSF